MIAATDTAVARKTSTQDDTIQAWHPAATLLSAVSDPIRLAVLGRLTVGTVHVAQLLEDIPIAPNLLSYHLRVLREAGLIEASRRGRCIDYQLAGDAFARLHAAIPLPREERDHPASVR